jgi:hypothetical protein
MMTDKWDMNTIAALSPAHVGSYLRAQGWTNTGPFGANGLLYTKQVLGSNYQLVLPTRPTISDFVRRMTELIEELGKAENRATASFLNSH